MKKFFIALALVLLVVALYFAIGKPKLGDYQAVGVNQISSMDGYSTSTLSYGTNTGVPVRLLPRSNGRQLAVITTHSDNPVYLFFPDMPLNYNFTASSTIAESMTNHWETDSAYGNATGTITDLSKGLKLTASSSPFIIDLSRQINSEIWASSTHSSVEIRAVYNR